MRSVIQAMGADTATRMIATVPEISINGLIIAFLPALIVVGIMFRWRAAPYTAIYATARMLVQLLLIGYVLVYLFESDHFAIIIPVLVIMLAAAGWIAIRPLREKHLRSYFTALIAIAVGSIPILALVTQCVIELESWFSPRYIIPLAGMIIAGAMNAVSLAAERFEAEGERGMVGVEAKRIAFHAALIPTINSLFAVGLVSLPGIMTGQILSGVSPLVATKYQIVVMTMLFGASGIAAALYLTLHEHEPRSPA
jgi:putative ABC transport system permease protein